MDGSSPDAQRRQSVASALLGTDGSGDPGSATGGTFPFPLSDPASLFNFHAPVGDPAALGTPLFGAFPGLSLSSPGGQAPGLPVAASAGPPRTQLLGSALYGMDFGAIQPLDGLYAGTMNMFSGQDSLDPAGALGLLSGLPQQQQQQQQQQQDMAFPLLTPISPFGGGQSAEQATAVSAASTTAATAGPQHTTATTTATAPRIDQACKMCRRRKVRCDGGRPSCAFCQSKRFPCVYEPAAPSGRKRGRRERPADLAPDSAAAKQQRHGSLLDGIGESPDRSDLDSAESSANEDGPAGGYLEALSNRQIALLGGGAGPEFSVDDVADPAAPDGGAAAAAPGSPDGAGAAGTSAAERNMRLYFEYFHPQHPILHRHTFERSVRDGTVNKALWHAVQAIAARYGPAPEQAAGSPAGGGHVRRARPYEFGRRHAALVCAMLPEAARAPSIEAIQALFLLSEHQFGMGDWLEGSTYWGTAVRMFNQLQLHMTDEAFQFPAYTSHLGLHESAISPLTCRQSPAHYAGEMRKPTLDNESWIRRELVRRMRWTLFESERIHSLAGGRPPLVTLGAGWVHMPCSDALWETPAPRRAAECERLLLQVGRYYVDTGGSLRIDMDAAHAEPGLGLGLGPDSQQQLPPPNRVASMLVSVRRRRNRIHLGVHTAMVIGQLTRARLALFRLFFPCRWPSQLMSMDLPGGGGGGSGGSEAGDLGGGGGAPGPVVLDWDERFRRMRAAVGDIEAKLAQWRAYLELMYPLREHEEGSGRTAGENREIHRERVEYANYRFMLAALLIQNRAVVLQLQACLARRERKIRSADAMGETARQTLANHVLPNQPDAQAMQELRAYAQECWDAIVRQACEIADLLASHWQVRPPADPSLHVLIRPDWHAPNAIKAKINAEANLRRGPGEQQQQQQQQQQQPSVFFSHETPPHPLLVVNRRLLDTVVGAADAAQQQEPAGAELALAASMNSNIHIETNANARDSEHCVSASASASASAGSGSSTRQRGGSQPGGRRRTSGAFRPQISTTDGGEVDFGSSDEADEPGAAGAAADPFRMQLAGTAYYLFLAAKTLIMYIHHAKMSAYVLARRGAGAGGGGGGDTAGDAGSSSSGGGDDGILPSSSVSVGAGAHERAGPGMAGDLSPPTQLRTLADVRRMQDRLEVVMAALRAAQRFWMGVDYYVLCARKLRNAAAFGPWCANDPVSSDAAAELANEAWPLGAAGSPVFGS
ncbi:hypothetical protein H4R18_003999 [Coemansia javaensis]|uniref:Zn(2)-C6 fungal-type domain-containing protein n=1 Tax=Coemansia javaensis TaxID=2761396 RepID=A0A9W8HC29_9FUNG|nr:hypothetical protein H4R18_003999 [Coemansia javaensis]